LGEKLITILDDWRFDLVRFTLIHRFSSLNTFFSVISASHLTNIVVDITDVIDHGINCNDVLLEDLSVMLLKIELLIVDFSVLFAMLMEIHLWLSLLLLLLLLLFIGSKTFLEGSHDILLRSRGWFRICLLLET